MLEESEKDIEKGEAQLEQNKAGLQCRHLHQQVVTSTVPQFLHLPIPPEASSPLAPACLSLPWCMCIRGETLIPCLSSYIFLLHLSTAHL